MFVHVDLESSLYFFLLLIELNQIKDRFVKVSIVLILPPLAHNSIQQEERE